MLCVLLLSYWQAFNAWSIELKPLKNMKHIAKDIVDIVAEIVKMNDLEKHLISVLE